jgi:hypothetical protein
MATLLEMTQDILSSLDSDEVNSISDSVESAQVATIIRRTFDDLVADIDLPEHEVIFQLTASGDNDKPTLMTRPVGSISVIKWIKYNCETTDDTDDTYKTITPLNNADFFELIHGYRVSEDNVLSFTHPVGGDTMTFYYVDDKAPQYYTMYGDSNIIFDSYDASVDTTLQKAKTFCLGKKIPTWTHSDSFSPDLDQNLMARLYNEAKALAWAELKQSQHPKAEMTARRQKIRSQKIKYAAVLESEMNKTPHYGRK